MEDKDPSEFAIACVEIVIETLLFISFYTLCWILMELIGLIWNSVRFDYNSNFWACFWIWGFFCGIQSYILHKSSTKEN